MFSSADILQIADVVRDVIYIIAVLAVFLGSCLVLLLRKTFDTLL